MPAGITRRSFLAGTAGAVLVACAKEKQSRQPAGTVVVANHPLYINDTTNTGFERATGTRVEYHEEITDDGAWLSSIAPQLARGESIDRDVVIVSDWIADRLDRRGWLADADPSGPARVIWAMGMVGIAYDRHSLGTAVTRLADLFKLPLHGRVALPTDMRLALGTALLADHTDPSTVTLAAATATAERLANSVKLGQVVPFDRSRPIDRLVAGDVDAAVVPASDTVGLEHAHPDIRFVVPEEGGLLLTDMAVVPVKGPNPTGARRYLDYVNDPVHAAERYRVLPVMWSSGPIASPGAVDSYLRVIAPDAVSDPRRNPPADVRARLHGFRFLDPTEDRDFSALFESVVHAAR